MNRTRAYLVMLSLSTCLACPATSKDTNKGTGKAEVADPAKPEGEAKPKAEPKPEGEAKPISLPPIADIPPLPAIEVHAETTDCPALSALAKDATDAQKALRPLAEGLRAGACAPEIFGQLTEDARATMKVPTEVPLQMWRRAARFDQVEPFAVHDLFAAMGVDEPQMRYEGKGMVGYWVIEIPGWGPGVIELSLMADRHEGTVGELRPIPKDTTTKTALVHAPEEVIEFVEDTHAAAVVAHGLAKLVEQPELLGVEPTPALDAIWGERFVALYYSEGSDPGKREGFTIRPRRTELLATKLAEVLELPAPGYEAEPIRDANPHRLASAGKTRYQWHGLWLEIELERRHTGGNATGLDEWAVSEILVLPPG